MLFSKRIFDTIKTLHKKLVTKIIVFCRQTNMPTSS